MPNIIGIIGLAGCGKDTVADMIIKDRGAYSGGVKVFKYSFADPLKQFCSAVFEIPIDYMYDQDMKKREVSIVTGDVFYDECRVFLNMMSRNSAKWRELITFHPYHQREEETRIEAMARTIKKVVDHTPITSKATPTTIREILQVVGTEVFRHMKDDIWLDITTPHEKNDMIIIPDCRFENEIKFIRQQGGQIIYVERGDLDTGGNHYTHSSEDYARNFKEKNHPHKYMHIINDGTKEDLKLQLKEKGVIK